MAPVQRAGAECWRASRYQLRDIDGRAVIEAAPDATWELFSPFDSYRPTGKARELKAGPHLIFLQLKHLWEQHQEGQLQLPIESLRQMEAFRKHLSQTKAVRELLHHSELFRNAMIVFAKEFGLLGAFREDFLVKPVLPRMKTLVAPEAVIDQQGQLRRVDPATKGKELLLRALEPARRFSAGHSRPPDETERRAAYEMMALPSEMGFAPRDLSLDSIEWPVKPGELVPWEGIRKYFGTVLLLDRGAPDGVSILCTREPLRRWEIAFRFFPSSTPSGSVKLDDDSYVFLNSHLEDVSPRAFIGKDGNLERGWRYRSLLQAMYVMLFLDLTGGATLKKCQSRGCPNYFRAGSQSRSKYCTDQCANCASTRMSRGQEP